MKLSLLYFALLVTFLFSISDAFSYPMVPDKTKSPSSYCTIYDSDFERFRYPEGIAYCSRNVASYRKDKICERDGVYDRIPNYTVDHIIPLSLGGSNHDDNLWCQHRDLYTAPMEYYYYKLVSSGRIKRLDAVHILLKCKFHRQCNPY